MNQKELLALKAEANSLQKMLEKISSEDVLDQASVETRLTIVQEKLDKATPQKRELARAVLTFSGQPVIRSEGIRANFATKALAAFTDAITAVSASRNEPLAAMGPVPNRQQYQMMITGTARGSFGFQLEESPAQLELDENSTIAQALESTLGLLEGSAGTDDEQLTDAAANINRRALAKIRDFVTSLHDNDATCTFKHGDKSFRFRDAGQVKRSLERLSSEYIAEHEEEFAVVFGGAMPHKGSCEFKFEDGKEWLTASIAPSIENPDAINDYRQQVVSTKMLVTKAGRGRPRYKLLKLPAWPASQSSE
jgi:hypothetical protein